MNLSLGSNLSELDCLLLELNAVQQSTPAFPTEGHIDYFAIYKNSLLHVFDETQMAPPDLDVSVSVALHGDISSLHCILLSWEGFAW